MLRARPHLLSALAGLALVAGCSSGTQPAAPPAAAARPSILLVTLDTTRADAVGPEASGVETPAFNAIAARGRRFRNAWATVPETLPSHTSMLTGLYPGGHGVHENGRVLGSGTPVAAEQLARVGYRTAAFVSSFTLARRFGLARGFNTYDDQVQPGRAERAAKDTTDAALAWLAQPASGPVFLWVHYYDAHAPYTPPEPFASRYAGKPYLGEVAAVDEQLGRLVQAFERSSPTPAAVVIAGDHGEGLGEHGEAQHGSLVYGSTMRVPLVVMGPGIAAGVSDGAVSNRHVYHTLLDLAGIGGSGSLKRDAVEVVLGEGMKPFLQYGWQPQVMGVDGSRHAILTGDLEVYDLATDAREARDLGRGVAVAPMVKKAMDEYPVPGPDSARTPAALDEEARQKLASLGYVSSGAAPVVRKNAPRPVDMAQLFEPIEQASALFTAGRYGEVLPVLERIVKADPYNLDAVLRMATAHSTLGHVSAADAAFAKAAELAPASQDVLLYRALHIARGPQWTTAVPMLERVLAESPDRVAAVEGLAGLRDRQGRVPEAVALLQRLYTLRVPTTTEAVRLGQMAMATGATSVAIQAFEQARGAAGQGFANDLELGVLYLAARRFPDAAAALDRVPVSHPEYPMALFKRAQVSVLLHEPDAAARIEVARRRATPATRELIARERLFQGVSR